MLVAHDKERPLLGYAFAHAGGCGDGFEGLVSALWEMDHARGVTRMVRLVYEGEYLPMALADIDGDGDLDILFDGGFARRDGSHYEVYETTEPFLCPC